GTGNPRPHLGQVILVPGDRVSAIFNPTPHEGQGSFLVSIVSLFLMGINFLTAGDPEMFNILSWSPAEGKPPRELFRYLHCKRCTKPIRKGADRVIPICVQEPSDAVS